MRHPAASVLVDPPEGVRLHQGRRRIFAGDVSAHGRLRTDGVCRLLQDVAGDDLEGDRTVGPGWVVRRMLLVVERPVRLREEVEATTWCSGIGRRWAERRTSLRGDRGGAIESSSLWVHVDLDSGRPIALPEAFVEGRGQQAGGREVTARLQHGLAIPSGATALPWRVRYADLDVLGHVNNAVSGAIVEEVVAASVEPGSRPPRIQRVELEYRSAIDPGGLVDVWIDRDDPMTRVWVTRAGSTRAGMSAALTDVHVTALVTSG